MFRRAVYALACVLALTLPAAAQEQTGQIQGSVKDSSGAVLPGVTVEITNISTGAVAATVVTDASGVYRMPGLRPGKYEVLAKLQGFTPAKTENVDLRLGQILTIDLALAVGGVTETVSVTAESPIIDTKQSARSTILTSETIDKLPRGRDFTSVVTQAPGANSEPKSGGISVDGSSASENRFIIDGAETTNLQTGVSGKTLVTDFLEQVQVKSSGYDAEFGGSTGAVINVVTKSGSNRFRGDVLTYFNSDGLDSKYRPSLRLNLSNSNVAEYITYPEDKYTRWEPGFGIGGPVAKDKLWFYGSYLYSVEDIDRTVTFRSNSQTSTFNQKFKNHRTSDNLTAQITNNLRARFAFNYNELQRENLLPAIDGSGSPTANYGIGQKQPNYSYSGNVDYVVNSSWFFGVRGGYYSADTVDENVFQGTRFLFNGTTNIGLPGVPASLQRATNFSNVPTNNESSKNNQTRLNLQADTTFYVNAGGTHAFKAGVQFDRIGLNVLAGETGNLVRINWGRTLSGDRGQFGYYQVRSNGAIPERGFLTQGDVNNTNVGLFIQDAWTISNRLTINLGLRTENETVPSFSLDPNIPTTAIEWSFGDKLAPRAGFAYDLKGDGKTKLYGSWGIFYDIFKLELPLGSFGGQKWLEYYYSLDTPDWTALDPAGCPPACPGRLLRGPIDFRHPSNDPAANSIDPDIKPMKLQEVVFGFEQELGNRLAFGARYVHKQIDRAIEDVGALDAQQNEIYTIGNPGEGVSSTFAVAGTGEILPFPKAVRDYDAMELSLEKRLSNNWAGRFSYTLSRLYGNYAGLSQSDENGRTSPNVGRLFDYPVMVFGQDGDPVFGRLATDRPHQFKVQGLYDFDFGTTVGANFRLLSGIPVTREVATIAPNNFPVQYLGRLSDGRTPWLSQTDLFVAHDIKLGGDKRVQISMNVTNLFNQKTGINKYMTELASGQGIDVNEAQFYRGFDAQALIAAQNLVKDPRFLLANGYQEQLSARFGLKFSF
jgi:Carboxypeptidase regulatory-like domain/TonB dependent receptor/TonB-dependent Receptor Plug Domain